MKIFVRKTLMSNATASNKYRAQLESLPQWTGSLPAQQKQWLDNALALQFPSKLANTAIKEHWKYLDLYEFSQLNFKLNQEAISNTIKIEPALPKLDTCQLYFYNGLFDSGSSSSLPKGCKILPLNEAMKSNHDLIEQFYGQLVDKQRNPEAGINSALARQGCVIIIEPDTHLEQAIQIVSISDNSYTENFIHHLIYVGANSQVTLIENYQAADSEDCYFNNIQTEIVCGENSVLNHYKIQAEARQAFHFSGYHVQQHAKSQYKSYAFNFGAKIAKDDRSLVLSGPRAETELLGYFQAQKQQQNDQMVELKHLASDCHSETHYRGIASQGGKANFNGTIFIDNETKNSIAHLKNKNLLLDAISQINTKPRLEIYSDDVQCTHGATVGNIDHDAIQYMRSRGLNEQQAHQILVDAFANIIIEYMPSPELSDYLQQFIHQTTMEPTS